MGVMKFRLPSNDLAQRLSDYRKAYVSGLDRTPGRVGVEVRNGVMSCLRETTESGRLFVPWPIEGYGTPIVGTATLAERPAPYSLAVELARGKLNDVRNQLADWIGMGLRSTPELVRALEDAKHEFIRAATFADQPEVCLSAAQASLEASSLAADLLMEAYTTQVLQSRLSSTSKLPTHLGCVLNYDPQKVPAALEWSRTFNSCQIGVSWRQLAPSEGQYRWDLFDAHLAWCRRNRLAIEAGPLIEFRQGTLPDWLWLWEGDFETISGLVSDFVRQAVSRYRGKVPLWNVVHRAASAEMLGLNEEEQVRIAARAVQIARQADPAGATDHRRRPSLGRMDGLQPFPARPLAPLRLSAPRRARDLRRGHRDRAGILQPGQPPPRPVRTLQAAGPLLAAERPPVPLDGVSFGRWP